VARGGPPQQGFFIENRCGLHAPTRTEQAVWPWRRVLVRAARGRRRPAPPAAARGRRQQRRVTPLGSNQDREPKWRWY
jgi:hypothetical protein